ncbi:hypothetical protein [Mesorhizobium ciceri]|uniref:hypothetical protein n=1 Tax=Mesorhizobium TaxID=68287 RepID=UPI0018CC68BF|nr:hypothetical protein [Mesorhizobium ciceri]
MVEPPEPFDFAGERRIGGRAIASAGIDDDLTGVGRWICVNYRPRSPRRAEKTGLGQEAKAGLLGGSLRCLGLVSDHMVVVAVMMVVADMVAMMMVVAMMLGHRGRIRARRADDGHRESHCNCKPEGREEGLLHGSFPFVSRAHMDRGDSPAAASGITRLNFFVSISGL